MGLLGTVSLLLLCMEAGGGLHPESSLIWKLVESGKNVGFMKRSLKGFRMQCKFYFQLSR